MRQFKLIAIMLCVCASAQAQSNFVKNPSFEQYSKCPDDWNQINYCTYWSIPKDSTTTLEYNMEYYNVCGNATPDYASHVPENLSFYQYPHSGAGFVGGHLFYDKTPPPPAGLPFNYRDNLLGRLYRPLTAGKTYCVSFWVNMAEASGRAQDKIGAYLDDGTITTLAPSPGEEITSVVPQVYSTAIIADTLGWTKIEGSFVADGSEQYICIGNFFKNADVSTIITNYRFDGTQYSYYLIDDVSVVPIDAKANAGPDRWVELGKNTQIGPVEDSTARGMDCKWYHKGKLIDSGNVISVKAAATAGIIDTYVVVQNVCGNISRDTMLLQTTTLSLSPALSNGAGVRVWPNPSNGTFRITSGTGTITPHAVIPRKEGSIHAIVYDVLGRIVHRQALSFNNNEASVHLNTQNGTYILELKANDGSVWRERIVVQ